MRRFQYRYSEIYSNIVIKSTLIEIITEKSTEQERVKQQIDLQKKLQIIVHITNYVPNLLTTDPNICYNERATVRVEIFGSGAVLIALTIGTAFIFAIDFQRQHPFL